jgi:hypothetical protein
VVIHEILTFIVRKYTNICKKNQINKILTLFETIQARWDQFQQ